MCACKTPFRLAPGGGVFNPCPDVNMALGTVFNYPWQSLCCQAGHAPEQGRVRLGQTHPKSLYFPIDRGTSRKEEKPPTAKAPASQRLKQDFCVPARKTALFARKPTGRRPKGPCPLGEPGEPYGHREQSCTQVHERQKAPDDAAGTQKAGFDGSSRQIKDLQNLELDASALVRPPLSS